MEKECTACKKVFYVRPSHFDKRFSCSKKCQNINQKNKIGKLNSNYKGGAKIQTCNFCNKKFMPNFIYAKRKYCSTICSSKSKIGLSRELHINTLKYIELKKLNGLNNPKKKCECGNKKDVKSKTCQNCFFEKIKRNSNCLFCKDKFIKKHSTTKFCKKECHINYLKNFYSGSKNPNWKNGITKPNKKIRASEKYIEWRNKVFIRDNYTCQDCKTIGGNLHAHHIKSFSKFIDLRFEITNGLTLCFNCHKKLHKNMNLKKGF
jgi:hypothetical protein